MTIQARYVGDASDPKNDPEEVSAYGATFIKGEWTTVAKAWADKIDGNTHFEIDRDGNGQADPTIEDIREKLDARGIKYSPRAGVANLAEKLKEAEDADAKAVSEARAQLDDLSVAYDDADSLEVLTAKLDEATKA